MAIEFRILGPLEVLREGRGVQPTSAKQRLLLAVLLARVGEAVSVDALVDALWGAKPPPTAPGVLQTYVSQLRKILEPDPPEPSGHRLIVRTGQAYQLALGDGAELDAAQFERLLTDARAALREADLAAADECLRRGLALWRGPALADVAHEEAVHAEALRLDELRAQAIEERVEAGMHLGRHDELVGELTQLVTTYPFRERLWSHLMLCLYRAGRQADALRAYQQLRDHLAEELGIDPSPELGRLEHDILMQAGTLDWSPPAPPRAVTRRRASAPDRSNLPQVSETVTFVGRSPELHALREWWSDDTRAQPGAFLIGEPGVGKTRLAIAFGRELEADGIRVLYGRAIEDGGSSYEPVLGALRHLVATADDDEIDGLPETSAAALALLVPETSERRSDLAERARSWAEVDRAWLLGAVASCLTATPRPTLLVLDDLQWADKPARLLLAQLFEPGAPLRVLATYREQAGGTAGNVTELLADLHRDETSMLRIRLAGLSAEEVADLLASAAGGDLSLAGHAFATALHQRTEGNPFFVRESLRHLQDGGVISPPEGLWGADRPLSELGIPEGVHEVVKHRLSHLAPATQETLHTAAVSGREFDVDIVAAVLGMDDPAVVDALDEATVAGLVYEDEGRVDRYAFTHALVQEVFLVETSRSRRARLHWRTGEAIERARPAELDSRSAEVAHHYAEGAIAGNPAHAVEWSRQAGAQALKQLAYEEAAHHYDTALRSLELDPEASDEDRADLLIALGRASALAGDPERRRAACGAATAAARRAGDADRLAHAAITLLGMLAPGDIDEEVVTLLEEAADGLRASTRGPRRDALLAEVLARLSGYLTNSRPDRSEELGEEALVLARRAADERGLALALMSSTQTYALERDEYQARLQEAARLAEHVDDLELLLATKSNLMAGGLIWADRDQFDRGLSEYADVAKTTRAPAHLLLSAVDHAGATALDGHYAEARERFRDALRRARPLDDPNLMDNIGADVLPVNRELGFLGAGEAAARSRIDDPGRGIAFRSALTRILCDAGKLDEAREQLDAIVDDPDALLSGFLRRFSLAMLAETAELLTETRAAARLYEWLEDERRSGDCVILGPSGYFGAVRRFLGLLALTLDRAGEAVDHHEAALAVHERIRAPGWAARSRYDLARALLARAEPGDAGRAARLVDETTGSARELGMPKLLEEMSALKARSAARAAGVDAGGAPDAG